MGEDGVSIGDANAAVDAAGIDSADAGGGNPNGDGGIGASNSALDNALTSMASSLSGLSGLDGIDLASIDMANAPGITPESMDSGISLENLLQNPLMNLLMAVLGKGNPMAMGLTSLASLFAGPNPGNNVAHSLASTPINQGLASLGPVGQAMAALGLGGAAVNAAEAHGTGPTTTTGTEGIGMGSTDNLLSLLLSSGLRGYAGNGINQQIGNLQSLYTQNSPYAQMLRQKMERFDASRGRRSQAGTREVELQARLADLNSRNAPMLRDLNTQKYALYAGGLKDLMGWYGQGGKQDLGKLYDNYLTPAYNSFMDYFKPEANIGSSFEGFDPSLMQSAGY